MGGQHKGRAGSFLSYWLLVAVLRSHQEVAAVPAPTLCCYWYCVVLQSPWDVHSLQKVAMSTYIFQIPVGHQVMRMWKGLSTPKSAE